MSLDSYVVPVGMTVLILCLIAVALCVISMAFSSGVKRPQPVVYSLEERWTHDPLLFSAMEIEPVALPRHFEPGDIQGGSASGKW